MNKKGIYMKNKKIMRKITQGMYVLTTKDGGCMVDAVSQISAGDNPFIAVAVMKSNHTNALLQKNDKFALSILGMDINPEIIETFGMHSMRDVDKFANVKTTEFENIKVIEDALGYMVCKIVDKIDADTHTLFIGKLIEADVLKEGEAMSYNYYQENKNDLIKVKTEQGKTAWICTVCGYVYYGEELPDDFKCPLCGVDKELFKKKEEEE